MFAQFHYQVRGRAHQAAGTRGQDRTAYLSRGGVQALCLADGAGSATHAELGAQAVADAGCALIVEHFQELVTSNADGVREAVLGHVLPRLDALAARHGCSRGDLASTLLALGVDDNRFMAMHVGDGVIGYMKDGEVRVISAPDNAEFANQTTFITSHDAAPAMRLIRGSLAGVEGFLLMSDGASTSLYDYRARELAPACAKLIQSVAAAPGRRTRSAAHEKQLRRFVDTRVRAATKDDCSIGILARSAHTGPRPAAG